MIDCLTWCKQVWYWTCTLLATWATRDFFTSHAAVGELLDRAPLAVSYCARSLRDRTGFRCGSQARQGSWCYLKHFLISPTTEKNPLPAQTRSGRERVGHLPPWWWRCTTSAATFALTDHVFGTTSPSTPYVYSSPQITLIRSHGLLHDTIQGALLSLYHATLPSQFVCCQLLLWTPIRSRMTRFAVVRVAVFSRAAMGRLQCDRMTVTSLHMVWNVVFLQWPRDFVDTAF